jgi:hypothetical protein
MLRKIAVERGSHLHGGETLKPGIIVSYKAPRRTPNSLNADYLGRQTSR